MQRTALRAERSAETSSRLQMASLVDGGKVIGRTLQADGAPPDDLKGVPGNNCRYTVVHADIDLFQAREEGYQTRTAQRPLRSNEGLLRPTEDLLRHDDCY